MAILRLANLIEQAYPVAQLSRIKQLVKQLKLKYIQCAADGEIYESKVDKPHLYFVHGDKIYRIPASKVPVT